MLLATAGQTASYVSCHQSSNGTSSNKLGRTTYKLVESSQKNNTTTTASSTVLMKTIAVRASRSSGFHSATHSVPANSNNKSNASLSINDNGINCLKNKAIATNNGSISKSNAAAKATSSAFSASNIANGKSGAVATTTTTSSISSSRKIILSASYLKTYTVPPTELHRYSAARSRSYSIDSLYDEMCHFKPIRSVPTTPWKCSSKSRGATIKAPKARLGQINSNCDVDCKKPGIRKSSRRKCAKAKAKIKPKLSANLFPHLKPHPSAFVRLLVPMCSYTIPTSTPEQQTSNGSAQSVKLKETTKKENNLMKTTKKTAKTTPAKKRLKSNGGKKQSAKQTKAPIEDNAIIPKLSNTKKRKAQTQPKKCESTISKKSKVDVVNRKTPPLTRRRIRLDENCKLYGPLA